MKPSTTTPISVSFATNVMYLINSVNHPSTPSCGQSNKVATRSMPWAKKTVHVVAMYTPLGLTDMAGTVGLSFPHILLVRFHPHETAKLRKVIWKITRGILIHFQRKQILWHYHWSSGIPIELPFQGSEVPSSPTCTNRSMDAISKSRPNTEASGHVVGRRIMWCPMSFTCKMKKVGWYNSDNRYLRWLKEGLNAK